MDHGKGAPDCLTGRDRDRISPWLAVRSDRVPVCSASGLRFPAQRCLNLRPEYQALLASGNLKPSEATELVRLSPRGQDTLFHAIRTGGCRNDCDLLASSTALVNAEAQLLLMSDAPPPPSNERPGPRQRFRGARRTGRGAAALRHPREPDRRGAQDQPAPESQPLRKPAPAKASPREGGGRGAPWPTCWPSCRPTCAVSRLRCARSPSRRVSSTKRHDRQSPAIGGRVAST